MEITIFVDGDANPVGLDQIVKSWQDAWAENYADLGPLNFGSPINLKLIANRQNLPEALDEIERVRNPDIYFVDAKTRNALGGVEITTHSPDGSNIEKRYPFLWVSRRVGADAFVATPYQKWRAKGSSNRFPRRHAERSLAFLEKWQPIETQSPLTLLLPISDLQGAQINEVDARIRLLLPSWSHLGELFAHRYALRKSSSTRITEHALGKIAIIRKKFADLYRACIANASHEPATTLMKLPQRWIQTFNARPDTGHWERGEGQFDSIDGRLMFTIDEISLMPKDARPKALEFWLPQLSSGHAWIREQVERDYGSKRLRNLCQYLPGRTDDVAFSVRYADQLNDADWKLLQDNRSLCLERLDSNPQILDLAKLFKIETGSRTAPEALSPLVSELSGMYVSTHRAYIKGWKESLESEISLLPRKSTLLCPRIPPNLLVNLANPLRVHVVSSDDCTKQQLLLLRFVAQSIRKT